MAGQEGLEPPAAGFGVRSSTIRATGLFRLGFSFLMHGVFAAEPTILLEIQLVRSVSFVLGRRIIFTLAFTASQENDFPHCLLPLSINNYEYEMRLSFDF